MQRVPHTLAVHVAPKGPQMLRLSVIEIADRTDIGEVKPLFHALADAGNIGERQGENGSGISLGCQIVTPLGLSTLQAIFASSLLAANPMEQVI